MNLLDFLSVKATSIVLWLVVLFHGNLIGFRDNRLKVIAALTSASWSTWEPWTGCNTLDAERRTRTRNCVDTKGRIQASSKCVGLARRTRQCESCAHPLLNRRHKPDFSSAFTFSSPNFRRTPSKSAWCSSEKFFPGKDHLEVAFKNFVKFTAVATRGYRDNSQARSGFVTAFKLNFSYNGIQWFSYANKAGESIIKGNVDSVRLRQTKLEPGLVARYIRVYPTDYHSRPCFDLELYGCEYNCGGLVTDEPFRVRAPNALQHTEEPECLWRIESKVATKFLLKFAYFKLVCHDGMLKVFDGDSPFQGAGIHEQFCGETRKISPQMLKGNDLWLHYRSNATTDDVGFQLLAHVISTKTLNSNAGEIKVPSNREHYAHLFRYNWLITNPDNGSIQLTIHNFTSDNLRRVNGRCIGDMLVLFASSSRSSLPSRFCDDSLPIVVTSTGGYLRLKFRAGSDNPKWKLHFSFKNHPSGSSMPQSNPDFPTILYMDGRTEQSPRNHSGNVTQPVVATVHKSDGSESNIPVIISSILAVVIAAVCLVALVHYLRKRKAFLKKHPYDCTTRPMSHFGDEDSTPFINTNVLMWNDSNSRNLDKPKMRNGKSSLPIVTVALRDDGPQRLSIIPPGMITANSEKSLESAVNDENLAGSLGVSDAFTEECLQLLNNNFSSTLHDKAAEKFDGQSKQDIPQEAEGLPDQDELLPEIKITSPEVERTSSEVSFNSPETDGYLSEVSD